MPVLEYQSSQRPPRRGQSLRGRLLVAAFIALGGGGGSFVAAVAAVTARVAWPFVLIGGPAAAVLLEVADRHPMSDSALVPLLLVAETAQYAAYGLLLAIPLPRKKLLGVAAVALHAGCCVYVATHLTYLR